MRSAWTILREFLYNRSGQGRRDKAVKSCQRHELLVGHTAQECTFAQHYLIDLNRVRARTVPVGGEVCKIAMFVGYVEVVVSRGVVWHTYVLRWQPLTQCGVITSHINVQSAQASLAVGSEIQRSTVGENEWVVIYVATIDGCS